MLTLLTAQQFVSVTATIVVEGGVPLSAGSKLSVVFTGTLPRNRNVARSADLVMWGATVPNGDVYNASVENLPAGFSVKSIGSPLRIRIISASVILVALVFIVRLYFLQIVYRQDFATVAERQYVNTNTHPY